MSKPMTATEITAAWDDLDRFTETAVGERDPFAAYVALTAANYALTRLAEHYRALAGLPGPLEPRPITG